MDAFKQSQQCKVLDSIHVLISNISFYIILVSFILVYSFTFVQRDVWPFETEVGSHSNEKKPRLLCNCDCHVMSCFDAFFINVIIKTYQNCGVKKNRFLQVKQNQFCLFGTVTISIGNCTVREVLIERFRFYFHYRNHYLSQSFSQSDELGLPNRPIRLLKNRDKVAVVVVEVKSEPL